RTALQFRSRYSGQHRPGKQLQRLACLVEAIDNQEQMPVDEAGRHAMPRAVGPQRHLRSHCVRPTSPRGREAATAATHLRAATGEETMMAERRGITLDAALAGGDIRHGAGRTHVAVLAVASLSPGRTVEPLAVGAVDVDTEDDAIVA